MSATDHHHAEQLAAQLPPLLVAAERVAQTVSQGVHGRRRIGQGETFWQFRRYGFGDAAGLIDWRQSAKSDPIYVREAEWEAAQSIWLWCDASPSMAFRSNSNLKTKQARAELLTLALTSLLARGGERVALLGTDMAPSSGRRTPLAMWAAINGARTPTDSLPGAAPLPRHARVVMIGDFLSPLGEIKTAVSRYADNGVRGHLLQVLDPAEKDFPYTGNILFGGPEQEGEILVTHAESLRADYRSQFARHCAATEAIARGMGWSFASHQTNHPPEQMLVALYLLLSETVAA